ncbi:PilN domain-containing protein [Methylomonas sp. MgM2]
MNLDTTIDIDLKGFFRWWGRELVFLLPKTLRRKLRDHQGCIIITPLPQGFFVEFFDDDDNLIVERRIDSIEADAYHSLRQQYPAIEKAEIVLRLAADQALQKVVFLPAAVQENLQQVVSFELDRYTPFKADQVYFSLISLGDTGYGQLRVLLIVVPRVRLDEQLKFLQTFLGLQPHRVDYQAADSEFPQTRRTYNLLPESFRQRANKFSQSAYWLVNGLLILLLLAVLILPVWMQGQAVADLKTRIKQLENQNRVVDAQQTEIDALRAQTQQLIDIKQQSPALLPVLSELTKLLNDDTWLTHLQYSGQHIQIQGQSPAASALIGVLERSDFFSNVSFVSPLTQDKITGRERFQISMDISMPISTDGDLTNSATKPPKSASEVDQPPMTEELDMEFKDEGGDE